LRSITKFGHLQGWRTLALSSRIESFNNRPLDKNVEIQKPAIYISQYREAHQSCSSSSLPSQPTDTVHPKFIMESVESAPTADSFTALQEHQQQTPNTFFGGAPVLHLHCSDAKVLVSRNSLADYSHLQSLLSQQQPQGQEDEEVVISGVQIWVSSRFVLCVPNMSLTIAGT
jgi:hypothetical protein